VGRGLVTLHHGDCIEVMAAMEPESVDAIVTDPPYDLTNRTPDVKACEACGRVLGGADGKPAICPRCGGPLSYQRSVQGRGFMGKAWDGTGIAFRPEMWAECLRVAKPSAYLLAFGGTRTVHRMTCAIEDAGWIVRDMLVWAYACLSDDTEVLTSEGWVRYNSARDGQLAAAFDPATGAIRWERIEAVHRYDHEGPMAHVGPSLVTLNHRVILDEATARVPRLPGVWNGVHEAVGVGQEGGRVVLLHSVQRHGATAGPALSDRYAGGLDGGVTTLGVREDDRPPQSGLEGRRYRVQEARELLGRPLRAITGVGAADGPQGRLRHGASATDGRGVRLPDDADGMRQPRGPRSDEQRPIEPDALAGQPDAQALRMGQVSGGYGEPDAVREVYGYRGVVWCITVPSGAFVARRNGVVFVTGNSGFPKSKASLKPAWEPIVMARKPGPLRMLAIDACRIPATDNVTFTERIRQDDETRKQYRKGTVAGQVPTDLGRWPANVVLTDPILDGGWDGVVGGGEATTGGNINGRPVTGYGKGWADERFFDGYGDSGTYSRFFLVPKAARSDREPVLGGLPDGFAPTMGNGIGGRQHDPANVKAYRANVHPTVKPTELMRHLVRLVTPTGGTVLDPFLGSGTTALAAEMEGFAWVGIEREAEYVAIAEARLNGTQRGLGLDVPAPTTPRTWVPGANNDRHPRREYPGAGQWHQWANELGTVEEGGPIDGVDLDGTQRGLGLEASS